MKTKAELAVERGCRTFDCALPQRWLYETAQQLASHAYGDNCAEHVDNAQHRLVISTVWCYDREFIFGEPVYLHPLLAQQMVELANEENKS